MTPPTARCQRSDPRRAQSGRSRDAGRAQGDRQDRRWAEVSQLARRARNPWCSCKGGSRAVTALLLNPQSDKSTQLLDRFGGVLGFLGCQDGDLAAAPVQDAVMDCRARQPVYSVALPNSMSSVSVVEPAFKVSLRGVSSILVMGRSPVGSLLSHVFIGRCCDGRRCLLRSNR